MSVFLAYTHHARPVWSAIKDFFAIYGTVRALAAIRIDDICADDWDVQDCCEAVGRELGITLELPCMYRTFGELAAYCTRALMRKELH